MCGHTIDFRAFPFLILLLLLNSVAGAFAWDPEPFRRDEEISGRDFEFDDASFLNRFSFRYPPAWSRAWQRNPQGFRGTGGSVRSDELYVLSDFRKRWSLEGPLFFDFRHHLGEDFDGGYERTVLGLGTRLSEHWVVSVLGDPVNEKEDIDIFLESVWLKPERGRLRVAFVAPDATFNRRATGLEYDRRPYTLFAEAYFLSHGGSEWGAWVNWNTPLELIAQEFDLAFKYRQLTAGGVVMVPISGRMRLHGTARMEDGSRDVRDLTNDDVTPGRLRRDYYEAGLELERDLSDVLGCRLGVQRFAFSEEDAHFQRREQKRDITRNEWLLHGGVSWQATGRMRVSPSVYLDRIDNEEEVPTDPAESDSEDGFIGKFAFPLEFAFAQGRLMLNGTVRLDDPSHGGGNVQFWLPL